MGLNPTCIFLAFLKVVHSFMDVTLLNEIARAYGWNAYQYTTVSSGLINTTGKIATGNSIFLLQRVNTAVFQYPQRIDGNLRLLNDYLQKKHPAYLFTAPVAMPGGKTLLELDNHFYRVFPWVNGSHTLDVVSHPDQAYEAARQFGLFTALLKDFPTGKLQAGLPDFHNLSLRYHQFTEAVRNGLDARKKQSAESIRILEGLKGIVKRYEAFIQHKDARLRVTHHDTKISNVLFNENGKGLCVIDLDTVMPGHFTSDVGDMFRTYVCPVSEEENELSRVMVRAEIVNAIEKGYLSAMAAELSTYEMDHFHFGGEILLYMQAVRFLTDYLVGDVYYKCTYPDQNLVRARNQIRLLECFQAMVS